MTDGQREKFYEKLTEIQRKKGPNATLIKKEKYDSILKRLLDLQQNRGLQKNKMDYYHLKKYEIQETTIENTTTRKLVKKGCTKRYIFEEEMFDVINNIHNAKGHAGRDIMEKQINQGYANVPREYIMLYLRLCETCNLKKSSVRKSLVVKPIVSNDMNCRCQVDLIDMQSQPDGPYKHILNYQDHLTKMVVLRPLKSKTAEEVAYQLVDIFCDKGAPRVLQSDNGREFANKVVNNVLEMWPECRLVHGKPRHSQSQGSVERANRDVEALLACWQKDNQCIKWSEGLRFIQWQKNTRYHSGIGRSPYEAFYGQKPHLGLAASNLPEEVQKELVTEEQLEEALGVTAGVSNLSEEEEENQLVIEEQLEGASNLAEESLEDVPDLTVVDEASPLTTRMLNIKAERNAAREVQLKQAEKMKSISIQRYKPAEIGDSVMVNIPLVDRGRGEFPNVKAVITGKEAGGLYKLGTQHGLLKQLYTRNQFNLCEEKFLQINDVPQEQEKTLREVARAESMGSGQGYLKCVCKTSCKNKRCRCYKADRICNSRCSCFSCCNK
jgi:hypothetical protein